jgi:hypothetical protein
MIGNKNKLEKWLGECLEIEEDKKKILKVCNQKVTGTIQYGIRIPCAGGMEPLKIVDLNSKEKFNGEKPDYWFVGYEPGYKVKLATAKVKDDKITGIGINSGIFKYKITKRN